MWQPRPRLSFLGRQEEELLLARQPPPVVRRDDAVNLLLFGRRPEPQTVRLTEHLEQLMELRGRSSELPAHLSVGSGWPLERPRKQAEELLNQRRLAEPARAKPVLRASARRSGVVINRFGEQVALTVPGRWPQRSERLSADDRPRDLLARLTGQQIRMPSC